MQGAKAPARSRCSRPRRTSVGVRWIVGSLVVALAAGCATRLRYPDLGDLYNRAARYQGVARNPIIVIPGVLGLAPARWRRPVSVAWGAFRR